MQLNHLERIFLLFLAVALTELSGVNLLTSLGVCRFMLNILSELVSELISSAPSSLYEYILLRASTVSFEKPDKSFDDIPMEYLIFSFSPNIQISSPSGSTSLIGFQAQ